MNVPLNLFYSEVETSTASLPGSELGPQVSAPALLLGPGARLRFQPGEGGDRWSTFRAMADTRLLVTAWDGNVGQQGETLQVSLQM